MSNILDRKTTTPKRGGVTSDYSMGASMAVGDEHRPLPYINKGERYTKEQVSYRYARDASKASCGLCVNFDKKDGCRKVAGLIRPTDWCVLFEPSGEPYQDIDIDEGERMPFGNRAGIAGSKPIAAAGVGSVPLNPRRAGIAGSKPVGMVPLRPEEECDDMIDMLDEHDTLPGAVMPKRKPESFNRATLQRLIDSVRQKCDLLEKQYCGPDQDVASKAIEAWRQSYELKRALKSADDQVRESREETPSSRAYANLAIREFYKNYRR